MYLLLLGTLAFAQDATYSTTTTRTSDYGFTKGGDDEKGCEKTLAGCVDDFTTDYDAYARELEGMIDELVLDRDGMGQFDIGMGATGLLDAPVGAPTTGDVWTENIAPGQFVEHWFLEVGADTMLSAPAAGFYMQYTDYLEWPEAKDILSQDSDYLSETYVRMDISYVVLPAAVQTAQLNYVGDHVERFEFEGFTKGQHVAQLLREVHYDATWNVVERYDHWVFLADDILLDSPGDRLSLVPVDTSPTTKAYYAQFQGDPTVTRAAVVSYSGQSVLSSGMFGPVFAP